MIAFDQRELGGTSAISMAADGFIYVPNACDSAACRVHVAFTAAGRMRAVMAMVERVGAKR